MGAFGGNGGLSGAPFRFSGAARVVDICEGIGDGEGCTAGTGGDGRGGGPLTRGDLGFE